MEAAFRKVYQYAKPNLTLIGWMGLIGFPAYYFIWSDLYPQAYENLPLRLFCCLFFITVLVRDKLSPRFQEHMHWFYQLAITVVLPFFFFYMLLMNNWSTVWLLSCMAAIFLHILLVHITWVMFAQTVAGIVAAIFCAWVAKGYHLEFLLDWTYVPVFLFIYLFGNLLFFRNQLEHETKVSIAKVFGAGIAHEMRNPLSGLYSSIDIIRSTIPDPQDSNKRVYQLREEDVMLLREISDDAMNIIRSGNETIDLLLTSIDESRVSRASFKKHSIQHVLKHAVDSFGYKSNADKSAITVRNAQTFEFLGSDTLLKYVIYNLLKNAFYHRRGEDFSIDLLVEAGERENRIVVRDNGQGIPNDVLDQIFEDFYTTGRNGNFGLGLPFCRKVMRSFGGEISCQSKLGEWTAFTLTFPALDSPVVQNIKHNLIQLKSLLMISDDSNLVHRAIKNGKTMGFKLQTISVLQALQKHELDFEYDAVVVDLESLMASGDVLGHIEPLLSFTEAKVVYLHRGQPTQHASHAVYNPIWIEQLVWKLNTPAVVEQLFFDTIDPATPTVSKKKKTNAIARQTIMVVDDSETLRQFTSIILEKQGFNVVQCPNGNCAIETLANGEQNIDLILMDIEMPVMDGLETSRRIRHSIQAYANIPIIAHTGDNSKTTLEKILSSGMTDFLVKPSDQQQLRDKIIAWLS